MMMMKRWGGESGETGKSIKFADGSPVKGTAVGFLASAKNAIEHGYDVTWPIGSLTVGRQHCRLEMDAII